MTKRHAIALLMTTAIMAACESGDDTQYVSKGTVKSISCDRSYNYITLDNDIVFDLNRTFGSPYCKLPTGAEVTLYHDIRLKVDKITLNGSEEVENN